MKYDYKQISHPKISNDLLAKVTTDSVKRERLSDDIKIDRDIAKDFMKSQQIMMSQVLSPRNVHEVSLPTVYDKDYVFTNASVGSAESYEKTYKLCEGRGNFKGVYIIKNLSSGEVVVGSSYYGESDSGKSEYIGAIKAAFETRYLRQSYVRGDTIALNFIRFSNTTFNFMDDLTAYAVRRFGARNISDIEAGFEGVPISEKNMLLFEFVEFKRLGNTDISINDFKYKAHLKSKTDFTGIYLICNSTKNKWYVGQGKSTVTRCFDHFKQGIKDNAPQIYLDWLADDKFYINFIKMSDTKYDSLDKLEMDYIAKYDCKYHGYNTVKGNSAKIL